MYYRCGTTGHVLQVWHNWPCITGVAQLAMYYMCDITGHLLQVWHNRPCNLYETSTLLKLQQYLESSLLLSFNSLFNLWFEKSTYSLIPSFYSSDNRHDKRHEAGVRHSKDSGENSGVGTAGMEKRFAYSLLEKLLEYVDKAALNMKQTKPATRFSRRHSHSTSSEDVKFFGKVNYHLN